MPSPTLPPAKPTRLTAAALLVLAAIGTAHGSEPWQVAGRLGIMRLVIVPTELARDRSAYSAQIEQLCTPGETCFLNFYTNSTGAPVALPLPDAIDQEATAVFRRSMKQGAEQMRWSCRLQVQQDNCF